MPTAITSAPPTQALPDTISKKTSKLLSAESIQLSAPTHSDDELPEPPSPPPVQHISIPSIQLQSTTDHDSDTNPTVQQTGDLEDEYTLSAYGDISLNEIVVPPLPAPTCPSPSSLQPRAPQLRLRLKVQRPPMPKRRANYYIPDPIPHSGGLEPDHHWPGSPRPFANESPWTQHQPLMSPLLVGPTSPRTEENKPVRKNGSSLEKLVDDLLPQSPFIRLSPPGSPASQALSLPQETHEQKGGVQQRRRLLEDKDAAKVPPTNQAPQTPASPAPRQGKPKPAPWRTRLPPRLPIPKWDM